MASTRETRRLIVFGVAVAAAAVLLVWTLYLIRGTLLLVYVSALFAIGLAPLVHLLERQRLVPTVSRRVPRALAILTIYAVVIGAIVLVGMAVIPPMVEQAAELWRVLPERITAAQEWLVRLGILQSPITLGEAVQRAPAAGGADAVGTVLGTVFSFVGGVFGLITILLLTFYLLVESQSLFAGFVRLFPRQRRARIAEIGEEVTMKVSSWLGGQILLSLIIGLTSAVGLFLLGVPWRFGLASVARYTSPMPPAPSGARMS